VKCHPKNLTFKQNKKNNVKWS